MGGSTSEDDDPDRIAHLHLLDMATYATSKKRIPVSCPDDPDDEGITAYVTWLAQVSEASVDVVVRVEGPGEPPLERVRVAIGSP